GVVALLDELQRELQKDVLGQLLGDGVGQPPPQTPGEDDGAVEGLEQAPAGLAPVRVLGAQGQQQRSVGRGHVHCLTPRCKGERAAAPAGSGPPIFDTFTAPDLSRWASETSFPRGQRPGGQQPEGPLWVAVRW